MNLKQQQENEKKKKIGKERKMRIEMKILSIFDCFEAGVEEI